MKPNPQRWAPLILVACLLTVWASQSWIAWPSSDITASKLTTMDFSFASLDRFAEKIESRQDLSTRCGARSFGTGYGHHILCTKPVQFPTCYFYSFGINRDYSFDTDLANSTGCVGFAADPTVTHPSKLHPKVFFTQMAAKSYENADTAQFHLRTSVPELRILLGHEYISVLKMDCEGCEYSLARDVLEHDPDFFTHVGQFAVEVHYSRRWLKNKMHLHSFASLLELLEDAGMDLVHFEIGGCAPEAHATGVIPELESTKLIEAVRINGRDAHCHNYLFARV